MQTDVARCASCTAEIPPPAKFCPRCGKPASDAPVPGSGPAAAAPPTDLGKLPSRIPIAGVLFLLALVLGPAAIIAGMLLKVHVLLIAGVVIAAAVVVVLLLGLAS